MGQLCHPMPALLRSNTAASQLATYPLRGAVASACAAHTVEESSLCSWPRPLFARPGRELPLRSAIFRALLKITPLLLCLPDISPSPERLGSGALRSLQWEFTGYGDVLQANLRVGVGGTHLFVSCLSPSSVRLSFTVRSVKAESFAHFAGLHVLAVGYQCASDWLSPAYMFLRALGVFTGRGRRIPSKGFTQLTSKTGPKGYYKGKGVPTVGHHTRKGRPMYDLLASRVFKQVCTGWY